MAGVSSTIAMALAAVAATAAAAAAAAASSTAQSFVDEISEYVEGRYLGAMEAAHRILGLPITGRWPPVAQLHVHEENGESIIFDDDDDIRQVANRPLPKSTLTAFFELNASDSNARQYLYSDIPKHYRFIKASGKFQLRRQAQSDMLTPVGRMHAAYPGQGKRFIMHFYDFIKFKKLLYNNFTFAFLLFFCR
jgi:hypothetical protein